TREYVDAPALAVLRVGRFRDDVPAKVAQGRDQPLDDPRVTLVEETIEVAGAPPHDAIEGGVERAEDPARRAHGHRFEVPTLELRARRLPAAGPGGEIRLPPAAAAA